jgi:hypothetical protein
MVVLKRKPDLLHVVGALRPPSRFSGGLHRWKQKRDQDADDGDNNQQLHQGKTMATLPTRTCDSHGQVLRYKKRENHPKKAARRKQRPQRTQSQCVVSLWTFVAIILLAISNASMHPKDYLDCQASFCLPPRFTIQIQPF